MPIPTLQKPPSLSDIRQKRKPLASVNAAVRQQMTRADQLAVGITDRVGTLTFFFLIFTWTVLWLGWNVLAPKELQFDPPMGFVFWLFISNLIQLLLMPLILLGQNVQERHAEARADYDLEVNVQAEREIEMVLQHLEYQNAILIAMLGKMGVTIEEALKGESR